jgi:RNA polymerase sigma factor (sigma-70 family)
MTGQDSTGQDSAAIFEQSRPMLLGLAYRILGSRADAEDAVQDTFIKWQTADRSGIENPAGWLTTACTRRCIDLLRAAHRVRVDYVGPWLPEPVHTAVEDTSTEKLVLTSSLTTAFLLLLERLTPKERAAYLLHEIFDIDYPQIASTLDMQESACRKLVSRARANVEQAKVRHVTPPDRQNELLVAFEAAIATGATDRFASLLTDDIELAADGGGKVPATREVLRGKARVLGFVTEVLHRHWNAFEWVVTDINGTRGVMVRKDGATIASVTFAYDEQGGVTGIYIMRNPDKLSALDDAPIL